MIGITPYKESDWKKTNADRIRSMSDEELTRVIWVIQSEAYNCGLAKVGLPIDYPSTHEGWHDWLKKECDE